MQAPVSDPEYRSRNEFHVCLVPLNSSVYYVMASSHDLNVQIPSKMQPGDKIAMSGAR